MRIPHLLLLLLFATSANAQMYNLGVSFGTSDWSVLSDRAYYVGVRGGFVSLLSSSSAGQPA